MHVHMYVLYVCIICLSHDVANGSTSVCDQVAETRWDQVSFMLVFLTNNVDTSCVHIMQCKRLCLYVLIPGSEDTSISPTTSILKQLRTLNFTISTQITTTLISYNYF